MDSVIKITDRTEIIPPLDRVRVYQLLVAFRNHCIERYGDIYPVGCEKEKIDKRIGLLHSSSDKNFDIRQAVMSRFGYDVKNFKPIDCLVELLRNPRTLKRSLSQTWIVWKKLHGEIYFDDVLIVHTIRATAPKLFELLVTNIRLFRVFATSDSKSNNENLYQQVECALEHIDVDNNIYHRLLKFLFLGWNIPSKDNAATLRSYGVAELHPQGIAHTEPTDYFYRLNVEELSTSDQSDQETMQMILDCNGGKIPVANLMNLEEENEKLIKKIEQFGDLLLPSKVLQLTSEFFETVQRYDYRRVLDYDIAGASWRIHLNNPEKQQDYQKWLENVLTKYLRKNIRFANDIYYLWKYRTKDESSSKYPSPEVPQMYLATLKREFENKTENFIDALPSDPPFIWTLRHIIFRNYENEAIRAYEEKGAFFDDWQPWLVDLLITSAKSNPKLIAMYSVPLMYDLQRIFDRETQITHQAAFDEVISKLLFGNQLTIMMQVVASLSEADYADYDIDEQARVILDYAIVHSKKWIADKENSGR